MSSNLSANSQNIKKFQLRQKGKSILLVVIVVTPIFLGAVIYIFYNQYTNQTTSTELVEDFDQSYVNETSPEVIFEEPLGEDLSPDTTTNFSSPSTTPNSTGSATTDTIPSGVTSAVNSIEANGIQSNPYISSNLDTSSIPDGSTVKFARDSWVQYSPESGTLNATITAYGQPYQGSVTFTLESGSWKVTGYSLNS